MLSEKLNKLLEIVLVVAISCCCVLLFPQVRSFIVGIMEKIPEFRISNPDGWMNAILKASLFAILYFSIFLVLSSRRVLNEVNKTINLHCFPKIMTLVLFFGILILFSIQLYFNATYINPVTILKTAGAFFLFLIGFALTWVLVLQKMKDWRSSFVVSFLFFGIYVYLLSEVLSFFKTLTPLGILCGWLVYILFLLVFSIRLYKKGKMQLRIPPIYPFQWEYVVLAVILSITFFLAVAYPPETYDSMTYHLPRIEHWLQNKNLSHYYTSIDRQLHAAPFAEILILHGRALSGDDYLANLVNWFSLLGSIIGISRIAGHLGMNRKMQITAALFFATVPMAVLQASSTFTDLIAAFCIICMAERFLAWRKNGTFFESLGFGSSLGLSILTKGTLYPIALPFVLCFAVISIKHYRRRFTGACLAAILCLTLNLPLYTRNYVSFGNPLGGAFDGAMSNFSVKSFAITFIENIRVNIPLPLRSGSPLLIKLNEWLDKMWDIVNADTIFSSRPRIEGFLTIVTFWEGSAKNFLNMILLVITFIILFVSKKRNVYYLLVIGSWCAFAYCIKWWPWTGRLQLPLFALSAPVFSAAFENKDKIRRFSIYALTCFVILPLTLNYSRPLLSFPRITNIKTIWNTSRNDLIFFGDDGSYADACAVIAQAGIQNLGLIIGRNTWEYPLWSYIRHNSDNQIRIVHVMENNVSNDIDALFILDRQAPDIIPVEENFDLSAPLVLTRNNKKKSGWEIIYSKPNFDF